MSARAAILPPPPMAFVAEAEEEAPKRDTLPMPFGGDVERRFEELATHADERGWFATAAALRAHVRCWADGDREVVRRRLEAVLEGAEQLGVERDLVLLLGDALAVLEAT